MRFAEFRIGTVLVVVSGVALATGPEACPAESASADQALQYVMTESSIEFTVPAGGVTLAIPKAGFDLTLPRESGATGPRYFELIDRARNLQVSGWFEPVTRYGGLQNFWNHELNELEKESSPLPQNVEFRKVDPWDVILYETVEEQKATHHARMEVLEDQMWIDVHVTLTENESLADAREQLMAVLKGMSVKRR